MNGSNTMNCEEFRKAITADPAFDGGAGHVAACEACRTYRDELVALDGRIARALALDVPTLSVPDLPAIEADNVVTLADRRRVAAPVWYAVAASVLVAAILGIRLLGTGVEYDSLADEVLAHVDHEPYSMRVTDVPVADRRLRRVVAADVAELDHDAGLITYAQTCVINGNKVPHLVIQGERGPVMILLLQEEMVSEAIPLLGENLSGVILPVGSGSIAIVGERGERLEKIEKNLVNSVMWST